MRPALVWLALVGLASLPAAAHAQGSWHTDPRFGFKLLPPKGWTRIALKVDEDWLVAKYLSDKSYVWTDKDTGWTSEHKPELMVIAFVAEAIAKGKEKEKEPVDLPEDGEPVPLVGNPYADYEDFLDRTYAGGGFYVSSREDGVEHGCPVTKVEVKVEKLARDGPKRIVTWIYHAPGVDFAVQAEVLESHYEKLDGAVLSTLRSFQLVPRTKGELPTEAKVDSGWFISMRSMKEGTPEERRAKRVESERRLHQRAIEGLLPGWEHRFTKRCLFVYDADPKYVDRLADHCDALLAWLDEHLAFVGPDEYVRRPIVRVCANEEERASFARGVRDSSSGAWISSANEIVTCKSEEGFLGYETNMVNGSLFSAWLRDRREDLVFALPSWIQHGLTDYVAGARLSRNELEFRDYASQFVDFRVAVAQGKSVPVRDLMQMTSSDFFGVSSDQGYWDRAAQADMLVRFLLSPEGARNKLTKGLLGTYVDHVLAAAEEVETESRGAASPGSAAPKTEEEEEEQYRKRHEAWKSSEREKQIVQRAFARTFAGWSDKDWSAMEKAFLKFAD